ncbi:hypothetical protein CCHR01_17875 [Colletotrichum chrysophilum]|uniref:Uncharacterized protein n=1 Tax=Colletotrichum chrysophilum TaxID=1836956 RepID=A0AAD9A3G8_9PEZI|nr:hypothetical protein CCHR01_17875 [Colletotrichum chrysophilum]
MDKQGWTRAPPKTTTLVELAPLQMPGFTEWLTRKSSSLPWIFQSTNPNPIPTGQRTGYSAEFTAFAVATVATDWVGYGLILLVFSPVDTPKRIPHHYAPGRHRFPINHPSHVSTRRDG